MQHLVDTFADFCPPIQQLHGLVTDLQQFDYFAGPRLETVIGLAAVALIGDASHPLSGAFGVGAGFALEDAFVLGASIDWAVSTGGTLADALKLFDDVRSLTIRTCTASWTCWPSRTRILPSCSCRRTRRFSRALGVRGSRSITGCMTMRLVRHLGFEA